MPIIQQNLAASAVDALTVTATLGAVSTTGSMLIAIHVIDKEAATVGTIAGFSVPVVVTSSGSSTLAYSYKISDGTEQAITATWTGGGKDGRLWIGEVKDPTVSAPLLMINANSGGSSVKSLSTGTTSNFTGSGIAIAAWSSDTGTNTNGGRNYTNGFIEQDYLTLGGSGHDYSGIMVATKELDTVSTTLESTFSTTSSGDQMCAVMLVIPAAVPASTDTVAPTITAPNSIAMQYSNGSAGLVQSDLTAWAATASALDNIDGVVSVTNNLNSFSYPLTTQTLVVTFTAQDSSLNTSQTTANVTITEADGAPPTTTIGHYWSAALATTATVKARVPSGLSTVLQYSTSPTFNSSSLTAAVTPIAGNDFIATFNLTGLSATTPYYVRCIENGVTDTNSAKFKTMAVSGVPTSFEMVWGGDIDTGLDSVTMDNIRTRDSDLFFVNGDMHYADITTNNVDLYRSAFKGQFALPKFKAMMQNYNIAYTWDDHDFGNNDSDATSPSKVAAAATFREYNPAPYLRNSNGSVEHTFDYGRVRFIILDNRHDRVPEDGLENLLGADQEAWFLGLLESTANDANIKLVVVHTGVPWQSSTGGNDTWYGSRTMRTRVADKIWEVGLQDKILMMGGDAHMTAYQDGTDNTYDTERRAGWPVYQSGGISRTGSIKGGPYSITPTQSDVNGLYSVLSITDAGGEITVTNTAYDSSNAQTSTHSFTTIEPVVPEDIATIAGGQITRGQSFDISMPTTYVAGASTAYVEVWLVDGASEYKCTVTANTNTTITVMASSSIPNPIARAVVEIRPIIELAS